MGNNTSNLSDDLQWKSDAWFAMESGTFCVICGGPFDIEGDVYNIDPKEKRFQWLFNHRLLGSPSDILEHEAFNEGTDIVNTASTKDAHEVFLSDKTSFSTTGSGYFGVGDATIARQTWFDALRDVPESDTLIPLHDACIAISCRVIEHYTACSWKAEESSPLVFLNRMLQHLFRNQVFEFYALRNDILNLHSVSDQFGPRSVIALTRLEWWGGDYEKFYSDPIKVPDLTSFALRILEASPRKTELANIYVTRQFPNGLESLPLELLDQISQYLPVSSVIKLHRTSKTLAMKVSLDSRFWRKSLLDGSLLPHIWDLEVQELSASELESTRDWRSVAKLLSTKRIPLSGADTRLESIPQGFWNRCKIWSTVEEAINVYLEAVSQRPRADSVMGVGQKVCKNESRKKCNE